MKTRPRLNFWQIWNMSFGFLGIQFGFALQNANVSRIFETLEAPLELIPILWIAAPVTGLIVQPIVGYLSDNTWNRFGRRRPFFMIGALLASAALIIMPNSPVLWMAVGMLWILDASINISMEPFRAFVGDMLPPEQRNRGFAMQSFFIGVGSVIASLLPWLLTNLLNVPNTAPEGQIPPSVKFAFYIGGAIFFLSVFLTVIRTREYSPEQLKEFEEMEKGSDKVKEDHKSDELFPAKRFLNPSFLWILAGIITSLAIFYFEFSWQLYVLTVGIGLFGLIQLLTGLLIKSNKTKNGFVVVINDLYHMPKTMGQLAIVQFFSWLALFSLWIYTTAGVTSHHYDMKLQESEVVMLTEILDVMEEDTEAGWNRRLPAVKRELAGFETAFIMDEKTEVVATMQVVNYFLRHQDEVVMPGVIIEKLEHIEKEYNTGANWVGVMFAVYNGFAALVAFLLPVFAKMTNRRFTHALALILGAFGYISVYYVPAPSWMLLSMLGVGIAWASILSMPYAMLTGSLPSHKMGTYMGIFNFFIVIPQIVAASILGFFVVNIAGGRPIYALMFGGVSLLIAAITVVFVKDEDEARIKKIREELD